MTAFFFAVLMSFTPLEKDDVQGTDFIRQNGTWKTINEVNCANGPRTCRVQFGQDGPVYEVYDEMNLNSLKPSASEEPILIQ